MKVLHVSSYFQPHIGGMESAIAQICQGLVHRNYDLSLYTSRDPPTAATYEDQNGLKIRRFHVVAKPLLNPLTAGLLRAILKSDASIVHCHDEHAFTSNLAVIAKRLRNRPLILHCYGELAAHSRSEQMIINLYDSTLNRAGYQLADVVIQISPAFVPYVTRKFGISNKKVRIVPNAIDPANYNPAADPEALRISRNLPRGGWILYVGALIKRKGVQTLLAVFPEIVREEPDARLLIVGRGPLKPQLLKLIHRTGITQNVFFLEGLSQEELSSAYRLCKLVVLPTFADVAPNAILEAMLFHRPVISSSILGIREFFSKTALLVRPDDRFSLKEAILRLLRDEEQRLRLVDEGYSLLQRDFGWERRVEQIAEIYDSLL